MRNVAAGDVDQRVRVRAAARGDRVEPLRVDREVIAFATRTATRTAHRRAYRRDSL